MTVAEMASVTRMVDIQAPLHKVLKSLSSSLTGMGFSPLSRSVKLPSAWRTHAEIFSPIPDREDLSAFAMTLYVPDDVSGEELERVLSDLDEELEALKTSLETEPQQWGGEKQRLSV